MVSLKAIVNIVVGLLVAGLLLPVALESIASATLTSVDPAVVTMFTVLLPILGVIAIAMLLLKN